MNKIRIILGFVIFMTCSICFAFDAESCQKNIEADWKRQEQNAGREITSQAALDALVIRAELFLDWAGDQDWLSDEQLRSLEQKIVSVKKDFHEKSYIELRTLLREIVLANPDVSGQPLLFMKSERFTWQMLHEYLSYYYQATGMNGGGIYLLKEPGKSFETESLTEGLFPKGVFETLSLSRDANVIYFAFADLSQVQDDNMPKTDANELMKHPFLEKFESEYMKQSENKFHLFKMNLTDRSIAQLTDGSNDDFDPIELPDGNLVFVSTRRGGYGRCHGHWEPLRVHTLHRLNQNGSVQTLSWHETNEWHPAILHDGRILYTRWDYVDRNAARHHGLWVTNPDGTAVSSLFGNYTYDINACYQAKAVPDSNKILFVGGAHHLDVGGALCLLDPSKIHYDPQTAKDDLSAIEFLTPEVHLPEVSDNFERVCQQYYHSPWPLSEDVWLTAYSHEPLGGYLSQTTSCGKLGLYYRDRFGNLELLYQDSDNISSMYPIPLTKTETPPIIPSSLPETKTQNLSKDISSNSSEMDVEKTGTFILSNVYESLVPFPENRPICELRLFQLLPKGSDYRGNIPAIGHPYAANARLLLGTVPVEKDGSAHFKAPACLPLYFQAVDEQGKAVQSMRSIVYLQPGENRGCIGCHEQAMTVQTNADGRSLASVREPSEIVPGPDFTNPFSYPLFVQPILDRNCVSCHSDSKDGLIHENNSNQESNSIQENVASSITVAPSLTGKVEPPFTQSYHQLKPYLCWYEWLPEVTYRDISTFPGECGSDISPLTKILEDKNHNNLPISEEDRRSLYLWLDSNVPFYGVYESSEQEKQLRGEQVDIPALQ